MIKTYKIPFAFDKDNNVVDIHNAVKGIIYYCNCGAEVKLRGGEIKSDHFYHITESQCSLESSIHKAYKSVFYSLKKIKLPYLINDTDLLIFDRVELEKQIDDYIPDAIGYIGDKKYLIEFAKTSYIGERKEQKTKKSNLFCIEIDIIKTVQSLAEIEYHLVNDTGYKDIIHVPEYKEMQELRSKFTTGYRKLQEENKENKRLLQRLTIERDNLQDELKDLCLFYITDCKNGAKLYKKDLGNGKDIVGFQKNKVLNIKFNL